MPAPLVLILGAGGYLGANVHAGLVAAGFEVVAVTGREDRGGRGGGDWRALLAATRPDAVVNCAGATTGTPETMWRANAGLVGELVACVELVGAHLVHLGSSAEYGRVPPGVSVRESLPMAPVDAYGASKAAGTACVLGAAAAGRLRATVLRVFNPVGPGAPETSVAGRAARLLAAARRTGAPTVRFGSLRTWRDYFDVRDVADAVVAAVRRPPPASLLCNVAGGQATATRDLVRRLATLAGFGGALVEVPAGPRRSAEISWQRADVSLAELALGWRPARSLDAALGDLWASVTGAWRPAGPGLVAAPGQQG